MAPSWGAACRHLWGLEPEMRFLNHGSYGATPLAVLAEQDRWRRRMEAQPVRFFGTELGPALRLAAAELAGFVGTAAERLVFVENATAGVNAVLRSLDLGERTTILTTSHVYNAVRQSLRFKADRQETRFVELPLPLPLEDPAAAVALIEAALEPTVGLVILDHVASASALRLPVERIAQLCRERGVPLLIDGAHGPGMLELAVDAIGADWYIGNCHKWLCAPKGAAFIARRADAAVIHPTVVSHFYDQGFIAEFDWVGTRDPSSWLAVPAAIRFHQELGGPALRRRNHELVVAMASEIAEALGTGLGGPAAAMGSMATIRLPVDLPATAESAKMLHDQLWAEHRIEVPIMPLHGALWLRLSAHAYNEEADYRPLLPALRQMGVTAGAC